MTRKDLEKLVALKDAELVNIVVTDAHQIENITAARDDAITRVATAAATATATAATTAQQAKDAAAKTKADTDATAAKHAAELDATVKHWQQQLAGQQNDHWTEVTHLQDVLAATQAKLGEATKLIAALGGTALGQQMQRDARKAELQASIAAAQAELKTHEG